MAVLPPATWEVCNRDSSSSWCQAGSTWWRRCLWSWSSEMIGLRTSLFTLRFSWTPR